MTNTTIKHFQGETLLDTLTASPTATTITISGPGTHRFEVEMPEDASIRTVTLTRTAMIPGGGTQLPPLPPQIHVVLSETSQREWTVTPATTCDASLTLTGSGNIAVTVDKGDGSDSIATAIPDNGVWVALSPGYTYVFKVIGGDVGNVVLDVAFQHNVGVYR